MAIPTSKPLNLSTVQTEYGGSNPISMSEYRGKGNAPTSGAIDLWADFNGTSNEIIFELRDPNAYTTSSGNGYFRAGCRNGQYSYGSVAPPSDIGSMVPDIAGGLIPAGFVTGASVTNWQLNQMNFATYASSNQIYLLFGDADDTTPSTDQAYWLGVTRYNEATAPWSSLTISDSSAFNTANTFTFTNFVSYNSSNFQYGTYTSLIGWALSAGDINVYNAVVDILTPAGPVGGNVGEAWFKFQF